MGKEVKRPLVWATRLEVWKFLRKYQKNQYYEIDPKHHLNMMELKGCSKKALALYLECRHSISEDVILFLLKNNNFGLNTQKMFPSLRKLKKLLLQNLGLMYCLKTIFIYLRNLH